MLNLASFDGCMLPGLGHFCTRLVRIFFNTLTILGCLVAVTECKKCFAYLCRGVCVGTAPLRDRAQLSADICYAVDGTRTVTSSLVFFFFFYIFGLIIIFLPNRDDVWLSQIEDLPE